MRRRLSAKKIAVSVSSESITTGSDVLPEPLSSPPPRKKNSFAFRRCSTRPRPHLCCEMHQLHRRATTALVVCCSTPRHGPPRPLEAHHTHPGCFGERQASLPFRSASVSVHLSPPQAPHPPWPCRGAVGASLACARGRPLPSQVSRGAAVVAHPLGPTCGTALPARVAVSLPLIWRQSPPDGFGRAPPVLPKHQPSCGPRQATAPLLESPPLKRPVPRRNPWLDAPGGAPCLREGPGWTPAGP